MSDLAARTERTGASDLTGRQRRAKTGNGIRILIRFCLPLTDVGRPKLPAERKKKKVTITPDPAVLAFIDARTGLGKPFKDRTHAFEYAVARLMEKAAQEEQDG